MRYDPQTDALRRKHSTIPTGIEFLEKSEQKALEEMVQSAEQEGLFITGKYSGRIAGAYGETVHVLAVNEYGQISSQQIPWRKIPEGSARNGNSLLFIGVRYPGKPKTKYRFMT